MAFGSIVVTSWSIKVTFELFVNHVCNIGWKLVEINSSNVYVNSVIMLVLDALIIN
ncbi:hypothetical protein [Spiroplasma endosymbiont of Polydrusus formosus]|uniref:hypothetical protein n=1 Tax=Spiroplasma endosymbiont of Polydrusus formosus TaxID=3139326 RepID=UPI0035B5657B